MTTDRNSPMLLVPLVFVLVLSLLLTGCARPQRALDTRLQVYMERQARLPEPAAEMPPTDPTEWEPPEYTLLEPMLKPSPIGPLGAVPREVFDDLRKMSVAVDAMPLPDFIHHVFGELLNVNYVLDNRVPETEALSLSLREGMTARRLYDVVVNVLQSFKVVVFWREGIFYIQPAPDQAPLTLGLGARFEDIPAAPGHVRQIIPLQYTLPSNLMQIITAIPATQVYAQPGENALMATGPPEGIQQVLQFTAIMDRPSMRGRHAALLRLNYQEPQALLPRVTQALQVEGLPLASGATSPGLQLIPLERWRLLLLFAAEELWIERARYWVKQFDLPDQTDEKQYFLYFPENSRAIELLETLEAILGLSTVPRERPRATDARAALGLMQPAGDAPPASSEETVRRVMTEGLGDVNLAVDDTRNALVVYTTGSRYASLKRLLQQIDILPPQVLIEATVAEVTLVDNLKFGLEWYLKNSSGPQTSILETIGALGLERVGMGYSMIADSGKFSLLFNALAEEDLVRVLSSPRLTVRDGKSASMTVGTQVPVVTGEKASLDTGADDGRTVVRTYQYRSTGVSLNVTPTVHARDIVTLVIHQDVSEPAPSGGENPLILNRTLSTEVVAASGQTVVIGGLIKETDGDTTSQIPFLGSIPLLGHLFKTQSRGSNRTELVVMITPHIIRSTQEIDDLRQAMFETFQQLEFNESASP